MVDPTRAKGLLVCVFFDHATWHVKLIPFFVLFPTPEIRSLEVIRLDFGISEATSQILYGSVHSHEDEDVLDLPNLSRLYSIFHSHHTIF